MSNSFNDSTHISQEREREREKKTLGTSKPDFLPKSNLSLSEITLEKVYI
jgi:hypothetical protein